jgi:hypothetical protein
VAEFLVQPTPHTGAAAFILDRAAVEPHKTMYGLEWQYRVTMLKYKDLCGVDPDGTFPENFQLLLGYSAKIEDAKGRDQFLMTALSSQRSTSNLESSAATSRERSLSQM